MQGNQKSRIVFLISTKLPQVRPCHPGVVNSVRDYGNSHDLINYISLGMNQKHKSTPL